MPNEFEHLLDPHQHDDLPSEISFRVAEYLPGTGEDPVACLLYIVDWNYL